jgi:NAD-dependent deacetylase sirtuin 4
MIRRRVAKLTVLGWQDFVSSEGSRRRYWARSYAGWRRFIGAQPGPTYNSLAKLEARGWVMGMITQNVDR